VACLNWGCIPSGADLDRAFLHKAGKPPRRAELRRIALDCAASGVEDGIVTKLTGGVRTLLRNNGAQLIEGGLYRPGTVKVRPGRRAATFGDKRWCVQGRPDQIRLRLRWRTHHQFCGAVSAERADASPPIGGGVIG
jgi:hypothetical protein